MTRKPQDTSAEEPDGGNLHVRFQRGPGRGVRPGLLNGQVFAINCVTHDGVMQLPGAFQ